MPAAQLAKVISRQIKSLTWSRKVGCYSINGPT